MRIFILLLLAGLSCQPKPSPELPASPSDAATAKSASMPTPPAPPAYTLRDLMGTFDPKSDAEFVSIPSQYADRPGQVMRKTAFEAFVKMFEAAKADGIALQIRSATRNFDYQKGIWERKWTGQTTLSDGINAARDINDDVDRALKILEYSSMPGTSRHHWGTDIDLNAFNNAYFESGTGKKVYDWLTAHAADYGFGQPYSPKGQDRPHGYNEEKWHWSYLPISVPMTQAAEQIMRDEQIKGFEGDHTAVQIGVVKKYILGIDKSCKQWH